MGETHSAPSDSPNVECSDALANLLRLLTQIPASPLQQIKSDLAAVYEALGMPKTSVMGMPAIQTFLYSRIVTQIGTSAKDSSRTADLSVVRDELLMRHVFDGLPLQPALRILDHLVDATRQCEGILPLLADSTKWLHAVGLASDCILFDYDPNAQLFPQIAKLHIRKINVARAAARIRTRGAKIQIEGTHVQIGDQDLNALGADVLHRVRKLGGETVARMVFQTLPFDQKQGRYQMAERLSSSGTTRPPSVPWGYILQLAARAASEGFLNPQPAVDHRSTWIEACELSRDLAAIYDAERYNMWDGMYVTAATIIPFAQGLAIRDSAFALQQLRPSDLGQILHGLFDWCDDKDARRKLGFRLSRAVRVAEKVMVQARATRGPIEFRTGKLARAIPDATRGEAAAIFEAFTHEAGNANREYLQPNDVHLQSFAKRPFLPTGRGRVVLLDASWTGPAFVTSLLEALQGAFGEAYVNDQVGHALERLIHAALQRRGIASFRGKYKTQEDQGECDVVVQTPDTVIFVETKLRLMSPRSRSGSDVDLFLDLSRSMVRAQIQLGRHEIQIRHYKRLTLRQDDGTVSSVELADGQGVERIVVTALDYGQFQDRIVLDRFLRCVANAAFRTADPQYQKALEELGKRGEELSKQHLQLQVLEPRARDQPFFNCWFLSLPQVLVLLDGVASERDLWLRLRRIRHVTSGRYDFYADLADFGGQ
jgi:Holliday junction resolvase